jgi:hypothetical protein
LESVWVIEYHATVSYRTLGVTIGNVNSVIYEEPKMKRSISNETKKLNGL